LDTVFIYGNQNLEKINISKKSLSADIPVNKSSDSIISFPSKLSTLEPHYIGHNTTGWVECIIKNTSKTDTSSFLYYTGEHLYINSYIITGNDTVFQTTGWMKKVDENGGYFHEWVLPIKIPPNKTVKVITSCNSFMRSANLTSVIFSNDGYFKFYHSLLYNTRLNFMLFAGVIGLLLFLSISAIWQYILIKDYVYIFWAIYLFANALMGFRFLEITFDYRIISIWFPNFFFFDSFLGGLIQISYLLFMFSFLEKQNRSRLSVIVMKTYCCYLAITMAISLIFYYFIGPWAISSVLFIIPFLINLLVFIVIATLLVRFNKQKRTAVILVTGSTLYVICCLVTTILTMYKTGDLENSHNTQYDFYFVGLVFELTFFFVALAYRQRKNEIIALNTKQAYIERLDKILSTEKENNFLRQQFLRTQMNPHFIFNVLNSISDYVWVNEKEKANAYLLEFSKLIRATLDNSNSDAIELGKELETLKLYVSLENLRFENNINFVINVSPEIDPSTQQIPPLILQPYIENAIWHGILHKKDKIGNIILNVTKNQTLLLIEIIDDGIGRSKSRELNLKRNKNKSWGTSITKERIDIANKLYGIKNNVKIVDLYSETGINIGTKVFITLIT
jgi:sensor histidine kinase YesM